MASYLRPRRGTNALATSQAIVLKKGEVFFEIGNSGTPTTGANAKAFGKIKMGDGTTAYSNLGYFVDVDTTAVAWDNTRYTSATSARQGADFYTNLNNMVPTATVKTIFTNIKALLYNLATKVTKLNNDKADKTSIPTALSQLTADSTHRTVTDTEKSKWNNIIQRITVKDIKDLYEGDNTLDPDYDGGYNIGIHFSFYTNSSTRYTSLSSMVNVYRIDGYKNNNNDCSILYISDNRITVKKIERLYSNIVNGGNRYLTESIINLTDSMIERFTDTVYNSGPISGLYLHNVSINVCDYNTYVSRGGKYTDTANKTYYVGYRINYRLPN